MYIIHAISHGFLALQSSNTITDIPTCTIIGPSKSLSNQEHASSNMHDGSSKACWECSQDAEDPSSSPSSSTTTWY